MPLESDRPHTSFMTCQRSKELGREVILHLLCSPDIVPDDYGQVLPTASVLGAVELASKEALEERLSKIHARKEEDFHEEVL